MTDVTQPATPFTLGFDLARKAADPAWRNHLKTVGWRNGEHMFPAVQTRPLAN